MVLTKHAPIASLFPSIWFVNYMLMSYISGHMPFATICGFLHSKNGCIWRINNSCISILLQIFYPQNRTKSLLRIELCAHNFYPKNRLTKYSSILRIESYYTSALTCLHCLVLYIQLIYNTLNTKYMMTARYYIIYVLIL